MNNNIKKNFIWNMIGSTIYSFTSLIFMIIVTRINGVKEAGVFTFAFSFVCMLQVVGTYAGRAYQVTDRNNDINDCDYIYQRVITCGFMFLLGLIFSLIKGYTLFKVLVIVLLLIYRIFDAFSETLYAVFQKNNDLYKVGISLFLRSVFGVILFFIINYFTSSLIFSIISLILVNLIVFVFYDFINLKKYSVEMKRINYKKIKKLFISGFFVFIFTFLIQYVTSATKYAIDDLMTEEFQTVFGIILMPATLMALCSQLFIHPFLVAINEKIKLNDYKGLKKLNFKICFWIFCIGVLAEICCYFFGIPVLNFLYSIDLSEYLSSLLIIILGSIFYGMSSVFSNSLIAIRKNKIQTVIYVVISIFTTIVSYVLVEKLSIFGASIAYLLTMLLLFILYLIVFLKVSGGIKNEEEKI